MQEVSDAGTVVRHFELGGKVRCHEPSRSGQPRPPLPVSGIGEEERIISSIMWEGFKDCS
jgi:hypothetical protein